MKGKLIKVEDGYNLFIDQPQGRLLEATCSISEIKRLGENNVSFKKLSIKNCEAIENGYDLEELFESIPRNLTDENDKWKLRAGFITGFQKALELLSDKKFSEEDVISMIEKSRETGLTAEYLILTNQQTEFDVEIITKPYTEVSKGFKLEAKREPMLDKEGCLILKRII